ncbi:MAG: DUF1275 domain-containing protein [Bacteroides sp.]|nr:DUF1275 domain-containing protein [Bacteroides sp.]MCM1549725.1 DUF1275 domain-containing protein [Clostridium sp.]
MEGERSLRPETEQKEHYLECEKWWIFALLMMVGGFYGAYTYSIRGGVFCNAQTANFVLFAMAAGQGRWQQALYYLIPMGAYLLGAIVSEAVPKPIKKKRLIRWDTLLILIEILVVLALGFLPESVPFQVSQVTINFICSMQYNTFRQAQGIPMATTFCTNHLRQTGVFIVKALQTRGEPAHIKRIAEHVGMIGVFVAGAILSTVLCGLLAGKAIWAALVPLGIVFIDLLYADLKKEHNDIEKTPHGH